MQGSETSGHVLWGCAAARDVWSQGYRKVQKMVVHSDLMFDIWVELVARLNTAELEEVAVTLRGIWTRRNEFLQGKGFRHPSILAQQARTDLLDYKASNTNPKSTLNQVKTVVHRWSKPSLGQFKANWDAAVRRGEGRVGIGVIIRDHQGLVIGNGAEASLPRRGLEAGG
ncbi:uncharacterized protein LOC122310346 [Carya illinoinensis]|uniref:uncharacterized protein LOC122310346 n=1 Tax=Carya illinoinensis TaxID=32201 RepID=UPI001C71877B|nr:uncharacterized protein LOC122310346 [Carya illinoinensis]